MPASVRLPSHASGCISVRRKTVFPNTPRDSRSRMPLHRAPLATADPTFLRETNPVVVALMWPTRITAWRAQHDHEKRSMTFEVSLEAFLPEVFCCFAGVGARATFAALFFTDAPDDEANNVSTNLVTRSLPAPSNK